jgi:transcriptional regulator with XRE-family HTH domain
MSLDAKFVGARIRNLRVENGLSQVALGKKIKVNGSLISLWECGKVLPALRSRVKLAKFFKVGVEYLSGDGSQNRAEVRDMALAHSKKKLRTGKASAADVQAAIKSATSDAEKAASAREEEIRQLMRGAREEFLRKLARFQSEEG